MKSSDPVLRQLVDSERRAVGRLVVAPVARGRQVRVAIEGLVWMGRPPRGFDGWGVFRIEANRTLSLVREATAADIERHPQHHRRGRAVLVGQPGMVHDFRTLFQVELCPAMELFESVEYMDDGATCWYIETGRMDAWSLELQAAWRAGRGPAATWTDRQKELHAVAMGLRDDPPGRSLEARLAHALRVAGANLESFEVGPVGRVTVRWTRQGRTVPTVVSADSLQVVSSGICLSGRDADFDLTSIVPVMEQRLGVEQGVAAVVGLGQQAWRTLRGLSRHG